MATKKQLEAFERKRQEKLEKEHKLIDGVDYKICNSHNINYPDEDPWFPSTTEYFYSNDKNKTDHLYPECKRCTVVRSNFWAINNPEQERLNRLRKRKTPIALEYKKKARLKARKSGYKREYDRRPEVKARKYSNRHRNHEISEKEWLYCKNYFKDDDGDWCCAYCGKKIQDHWVTYKGVKVLGDFHKEHKDDDGANDLRNCIPSCESCNSRKWRFPMEEWYREQEFFTEERYNKIIKWCTKDYKLYIEKRPPYRIVKKKNIDNNKFHHELWSVDEQRNMIECIFTSKNRKDLELLLKEINIP